MIQVDWALRLLLGRDSRCAGLRALAFERHAAHSDVSRRRFPASPFACSGLSLPSFTSRSTVAPLGHPDRSRCRARPGRSTVSLARLHLSATAQNRCPCFLLGSSLAVLARSLAWPRCFARFGGPKVGSHDRGCLP